MSDRIELGIWTADADVMTVREYLQAADAGEVTWQPDPEDSVLFLEADGREWLGRRRNLGNIEGLVEQFEPAADRLAEGRSAIVRSAVDDHPIVPYLLWERSGDRVTATSFYIEDYHLNYLYPPDEQLEAYVAEHRDTLVSGLPDDLRESAFEGVSLPLELTVTSLRREAGLGRELLERLRGT